MYLVVNKKTATTEYHFRKEKSENAKGVLRDRTSKDKQIGQTLVNKILHWTWDLRECELLEYDYLGEWYQIDADQFELFNWKLSTISRDIKIRYWQQTHDDNSIPFGEMNLVPYENIFFCLKKKYDHLCQTSICPQ